MSVLKQNWHAAHQEGRTVGARLADGIAAGMGSWGFIITQAAIIAVWVGLNLAGWVLRWDPYPFILLNLVFSTEAAFSAPIIMMAQNRAADRDRAQAEHDYEVNRLSLALLMELRRHLNPPEKEERE